MKAGTWIFAILCGVLGALCAVAFFFLFMWHLLVLGAISLAVSFSLFKSRKTEAV